MSKITGKVTYKEVLKGDTGYTYKPHVTTDGVLYWSNNGNLPNPLPVNIKGKNGDMVQEEEIKELKEKNLKIDKEISILDMIKNNQEYNIVEFGVLGGTSKENATDITEKFKEIAKKISFNSGDSRTLYIPKGFYKITELVEFNRCRIIGDNNATIVLDGVNANIKFTPYNDQPLVYESFIVGIGLIGQNGARVGLTINKGSQIWIEKVNIMNFNIGIEMNQTDITHLIRPTIQNCEIGVLCNSLVGSSVENGNFWNNNVDFKFIGENGGIQFVGTNYFENSLITFLVDSEEKRTTINGLYFTGNMVSKNEMKDNKFAVFKSTNENILSINNFIINSNRFFFKNNSENFILIDIKDGNINNNVQMKICDNLLYNETNPNGYIIKSNNVNKSQIQICFQDNITSSGNVNIIDGNAWITGIDRSGAKQRYYNKIYGEIILDNNAMLTNSVGGLSWSKASQTPIFFDGIEYRVIPYRGESIIDSNALDLETLKNDFNNLLKELRKCKVIKS